MRESPGILLRVSGKLDARARRNSKPDAASSSQGRLKEAYLGGLMDRVAGNLPQQTKVRNHGSFLNLNPRAITDLDVITAVWGILMNATLQTAVHLGRDYVENLRFTKNQILKSVKQLFQVTEKLIEDQKEINNLTTIDCKAYVEIDEFIMRQTF